MNSDHAGPAQWCIPGSSTHGFGWKHLLQWFLLPTAWSLPSLKQTFPWVIKTTLILELEWHWIFQILGLQDFNSWVVYVDHGKFYTWKEMVPNSTEIKTWAFWLNGLWTFWCSICLPTKCNCEAFYQPDFTVIKHFVQVATLWLAFFPRWL